MPFPEWEAGMRMTTDRLNDRNIVLVEQSADLTVSASTAYVDSDITFTPVAGATYWYNLLISYSADEAGDLQWRWDASGATLASFTQARHVDATGSFNAAASVIFRRPGNTTDRIAGGGGLSSYFSAYDQGTVTASTTAAITMQVAQYAASGNTILRGGSTQTRLIYQRIA